MSWWIFIPVTYLAVGCDLMLTGDWAWRGAAPQFLVLLWSLLAVRASSPRSMPQACLLGILADLASGSPLGVSPAVFVIVSFLLARYRGSETSQPLTWLWWSFPLMLFSLGTIELSEWLLRSASVSPQLLIRHAALAALVTFVWGCGLKLCMWTFKRLIRFPRESAPRELEASSFFLSR